MDELRKKLTDILSKLFGIGDSYHYHLGRVKEAFAVGTMSVADFKEYNEDSVAEIVESLIQNGVEIPVRCKECVYYIADGEYCGWWDGVRHPDHFCGEGEKGCWSDGKCRATYNCAQKVVTNGDKIRAMTNEELIKWLKQPAEVDNGES